MTPHLRLQNTICCSNIKLLGEFANGWTVTVDLVPVDGTTWIVAVTEKLLNGIESYDPHMTTWMQAVILSLSDLNAAIRPGGCRELQTYHCCVAYKLRSLFAVIHFILRIVYI
jgi:hypothetical protein